MTVQARFCATVVDEWIRGGLTHAVIAPGSRSTPLAVALAARSELATRIVLDERSAAFVALGVGLATGRPAVVLTTSGTATAELLPPITPYFLMKVGHVPVIPYQRPGAAAAAEAVARVIGQYGEAGTPVRAVMLDRLGPNVWHDTPAAAMAVLEELEETARLACFAREMPRPLGNAEIEELRAAFGARW